MLSLPLIVPQGEDSSHSAPAPARGHSDQRQFSTNFSSISPSHGLQLFMNCPSVGPLHGVQSFSNRLPQHGSPMGSQALPANLLRCELLSPWVRRSWQEPAPAQAPHGVTQPPSGIHLLRHGVPSMGCRWRSAPPWICMGCRGTACLTTVFSTSCKGRLSAPASQTPPPPSFFTDLGVYRVVSLTSSHSSL